MSEVQTKHHHRRSHKPKENDESQKTLLIQSLSPFEFNNDTDQSFGDANTIIFGSKVDLVFSSLDLLPPERRNMLKVNMQPFPLQGEYFLAADGTVSHATFPQVVLCLTSPEFNDMELQNSILLTSTEFTSPKLLFSAFVTRFYGRPGIPGSNIENDKQLLGIRDRVVKILTYWLKLAPNHFDGGLLEVFDEFSEYVKRDDGTQTQGKLLKAAITHTTKVISQKPATVLADIPIINPPNPIDSVAQSLIAIPAEKLAKQITLFFSVLFKGMTQEDLIDSIWGNKKRQAIDLFVRQSDFISRTVSYSICNPEDHAARCDVYCQWCEVALELRKLNNFNGTFAVVWGLLHSSVTRLEKTITRAKRKLHEKWDQVQALYDLCQIGNDFSPYRKEVANCQPPCIPFIGCFQKDWIYFQETYKDKGSQFVSFKKCSMCNQLLKIVMKYQNDVYEIEPDKDILTILMNMPDPPNTTDIMRISISREKKKTVISN